jgi:hypothetical protein
MRLAVLLFAVATPLSAWAQAYVAPPPVLNDEAGEAAELGASLCGIPPSTITTFKARLDVLNPGTTQSPEYLAAVASIRRTMKQLRANGDDMSEYRDTNCELATKRINDVIATRAP